MVSRATTVDSICRGLLALEQPSSGYRFNVDSVILAHFAVQTCAPPDEVVDLGAGCGIVGLLLARRWTRSRVVLLEIQEELAALAQSNVERNGLQERVRSLCGDLRDHRQWGADRDKVAPESSRIVISNPPFFRADSGRASPCGQVAAARHEVLCSLDQMLAAAAAGLSEGEVLLMVHAMERIEEIEQELKGHGFGALRLRGIRPLPERPCTRVLVRATLGQGTDRVELDPLLVHQQPGVYSPEMDRILGEQTDRGSVQPALQT